MGIYSHRCQLRKAAKDELADLLNDATRAIIIHYSCESFYDRPDGASPRITSIAVRNLASGQTSSFSIHQIAERQNVPRDEIETKYNALEKTMLEEFYSYVEARKDYRWVHWCMRNVNYGFAAIAHRCKVLGGTPVDIPESRLYDLARILIDLFGPGYVGHPRLTQLMEVNSISNLDFLTGADEADAFVKKQYVRLHQSTLRKVDVMSNIIGRLAAGTLKTQARKREIYGSWIGYCTEIVRDHPATVIITLLASIASIVGLLLYFFPRKG
ncbi:MAG: hypothetical protein GXY83_39150 [Rhodopirellula sp.]|nr:hypothetical protein [Rhodopirellula sp.]